MNDASAPRRGMVLGKFLPPHQGHVFLIDFARHFVERLTVVLEAPPEESIPGELRQRWLQEMFPDVEVVRLTDSNPQDPSEHPDFWNVWRKSLQRVLQGPIDCVFASESYGHRLAEVLEARFVPLDLTRACLPIRATQIRENPWKHWDYLPRCTRPYFARRVCVFGPESTGKSTLAADLARHFRTTAVPEYARIHLEEQGGDLAEADIGRIARGQVALEDALALNANRVLICDTDLVLTTIWSRWLFGGCEDWIEETAARRQYDLYLVTDVDVPWVADQVRYLPEERHSFFERCVATLESLGRPYVVIRGDWEARWQTARDAVAALLQ